MIDRMAQILLRMYASVIFFFSFSVTFSSLLYLLETQAFLFLNFAPAPAMLLYVTPVQIVSL